MKCRHCGQILRSCLIDLGSAPASNAYLSESALRAPELWYPLRVLVCEECWLVQTEDHAAFGDLFDANYVYFSSYSKSWLAHAREYVDVVGKRFHLSAASHVVEIAANDGYLLQYFKEAGVPCTGVEPTAGPAAVARQKGIPIIQEFFGELLAKQMAANGQSADLIVANNVLAHVPDINDFVRGFACLLKPLGVATLEFPSLMSLLDGVQFDTIYHEHFSYLSLTAVQRVFSSNGLSIFDVEELETHGGSLRVFAQCRSTGPYDRESAVDEMLTREQRGGISTIERYLGFQARADAAKDAFVRFLIDAKEKRKVVIGYGAAAKGNTLLNYAGVRPDLFQFVVDLNPAKQGKFLPGSRIPIRAEKALISAEPDFVVVLPWNLRAEVAEQLSYIRKWDGKFVIAIPDLVVF